MLYSGFSIVKCSRSGDVTIKDSTGIIGSIGKNSFVKGDNLLLLGETLTVSNKANVAIVGNGINAFISDASYAGSFVAGYGNGNSSTNNRYYFGSNSWLFVSGTNLMFRNSAGNTGTITVTY
jgi:hypothetical protein